MSQALTPGRCIVANGYAIGAAKWLCRPPGRVRSRRKPSRSNGKSPHQRGRARSRESCMRVLLRPCGLVGVGRDKWYFRAAVRCATIQRLGRLRPRFSPWKQASAHVARTSVATKLTHPVCARERDRYRRHRHARSTTPWRGHRQRTRRSARAALSTPPQPERTCSRPSTPAESTDLPGSALAQRAHERAGLHP